MRTDMYVVLITGSRHWGERFDSEMRKHDVPEETAQITDLLMQLYISHSPGLIIRHGDCPTGADRIVHDWCDAVRASGVEDFIEQRRPADWEKWDRAAGPIRNEQMVKEGADQVYAFIKGDSRGTRDCVRRAKKAGIPVEEYRA